VGTGLFIAVSGTIMGIIGYEVHWAYRDFTVFPGFMPGDRGKI
jgi:hypothetical protein